MRQPTVELRGFDGSQDGVRGFPDRHIFDIHEILAGLAAVWVHARIARDSGRAIAAFDFSIADAPTQVDAGTGKRGRLVAVERSISNAQAGIWPHPAASTRGRCNIGPLGRAWWMQFRFRLRCGSLATLGRRHAGRCAAAARSARLRRIHCSWSPGHQCARARRQSSHPACHKAHHGRGKIQAAARLAGARGRRERRPILTAPGLNVPDFAE